ncbi:MAG: DnaJ domain-containing protein [Acidobacteria bacterium]|nr:DnaJ domain-containing protein [Acidobacteriota bacterium]
MSIHAKLTATLLNLAAAGRSGVFRTGNSSGKRQLVLKNGAISFAESSFPEEHLARIMVSMGLLRRADLREIASMMKSGKSSEQAVASLKRTDEKTLEKGLREQVIVVLSSTMGWKEVEMRFFQGKDLIKNRRNLGLNIPEMLVSGARRAVSKRLVKAPRGFLDGKITVDRDFAEKRTELPLNAIESHAYLRAHDEIPAKELAALLSSGEEAAPEEVLLRLYALGLIGPETSPEIPPENIREPAVSGEISMRIDDLLLRFKNAGLYEILSVRTDAGPDEIRDAYHNLAKAYHPDHFQSEEYPGDLQSRVERVFTYINDAYTTLRDPDLRSEYDSKGLSRTGGAAARTGGPAGSEQEEVIDALFRQGRQSLARGEFEKAAKELKSCVHLRPGNASYNYFLGLAESEVPGLYKSAEQHLIKAIELESMSADSHIALVKFYLKVRLPRRAAARLKELMRWDPENPEAKRLLQQIKSMADL